MDSSAARAGSYNAHRRDDGEGYEQVPLEYDSNGQGENLSDVQISYLDRSRSQGTAGSPSK